MKKFLLFITLSVLIPAFSAAQADEKSIQVTGAEVVRTGDAVMISFSIHVGDKVTPENRSMIVNPELRGSVEQASLPPIIIRGGKAKISNENKAMAAASINTDMPFHTANGQTLDYLVSVPYQSWMPGSELVLNGINAGKGKATRVNIGLVANNLLSGDDRMPASIASGTVVQSPVSQTGVSYVGSNTEQRTAVQSRLLSTGDKLAARFPFVKPVSEFHRARQATATDVLFDYNMQLILGEGAVQKQNDVERFIDMTQEGSLSIRFQRGSKTVSRDYGDNNRMLVDLISSIRAIEAASDARIAQVIIVGFSSPDLPEDALDENDKLAMERAEIARGFLTANSSVRPELVSVYSGSMDWSSLRKMVAGSDMSEKYRILDILDNTPVWDSARNQGRMGELMALSGGAPYRYMMEHFFPQLRQTGAYIKVYYENIR